jgi:hypothetical protein
MLQYEQHIQDVFAKQEREMRFRKISQCGQGRRLSFPGSCPGTNTPGLKAKALRAMCRACREVDCYVFGLLGRSPPELLVPVPAPTPSLA